MAAGARHADANVAREKPSRIVNADSAALAIRLGGGGCEKGHVLHEVAPGSDALGRGLGGGQHGVAQLGGLAGADDDHAG